MLLACVNTYAQDAKPKAPRILILLDGSSSMLHEWTNDDIRFEAAAQIVDKLMDSVYSVNKDVEFALRVYGHQHPTAQNNCFDSKLEVQFSKDNYTQMMLRMAALSPLGISPIAYSLQQAAENDMRNLNDNKYSLILITDGGESCEGDICKVVDELLRKKIDFKPYILSLVDYAPLRKQYDCMGDYLLVTTPADIEPVVGKIVESYRRSFIQPNAVSKTIEASRKAPSVLRVKTPEVAIKVPEPETSAPVVTTQPEPKKPEPVIVQQLEPEPIPEPEPEPEPVPEPPKPSKIVVEEVVQPVRIKQDVFYIPSASIRQMPRERMSRSMSVVRVAPVVITVPEPEKPAEPVYKAMPTTKTTQQIAAVRATPQPKSVEYTVSREEAKETSLAIFFTNGKGKYYESAPEVVLRDMKTNEPVYKFYRNVDVYGQPRPEKSIPPGTYNLTITGKDGYAIPNIEVRENEKNKYELVVTDGTLGFTYSSNPSKPVREFSARVGKTFTRGAVNTQLCSELVAYEPGNYHVDIFTNPVTTRNVDLDFGVTVYLDVEEPGGIEVYNTGGYQNIQFYFQHGDQYEQFKPMNVVGDAGKQEFMIQPGRYKVAYIRDPRVPNPKPNVKEFIIKSNTITEVVLD